jgi:hypothetical protein
MRFMGLFGALAVLVIALVAGAIGYSLGIGANIATNGTAVAPVVYPFFGWGFGLFHIFGFIFFLILLFVIFGAIRRAAFGAHQRGYGHGYGPGGWWRSGADDAFERWHRRAHGQPDDSAAGQAPPAK